MSRSVKKGPFVDFKLYRKVQRQEAECRKEPIKTWSRRSTITPKMVANADALVGYFGALADWLDWELLLALARARPDWTILLVGDRISSAAAIDRQAWWHQGCSSSRC